MSTSPRTALRRLPERGLDDPDERRETLESILDEALVAHVGYLRDGHPVVVPTLHARHGGSLLLHGSPAAGFLRAARAGQELCVSVTLLDALVLARSAFHHSVNYRSAVVFGRASRLTGDDRRSALDAIVERLVPGRSRHLRPMTGREVRQTEVVSLPLDEASVKVRSGWPRDEEEDYDLPIWAGIVPVLRGWAEPLADPRNLPAATPPDHLGFLREKGPR